MAEKLTKTEIEQQFRESLADLQPILEELQDYCDDPKEILPIITLACENKTQLRILAKLLFREK